MMFIFCFGHHGRVDESEPWNFTNVLDYARGWWVLLENEWIGFREVGSEKIYVLDRGPKFRKVCWNANLGE